MTKEQAYDAIVAKAVAANTQLSSGTLTGAQWDSIRITLDGGVQDIILTVPGHPPLDKLKRTRPTP